MKITLEHWIADPSVPTRPYRTRVVFRCRKQDVNPISVSGSSRLSTVLSRYSISGAGIAQIRTRFTLNGDVYEWYSFHITSAFLLTKGKTLFEALHWEVKLIRSAYRDYRRNNPVVIPLS